jgi:Fe-S-cluster containining protein
MFESLPITVLDECEGRTNPGDNHEIVSFNLDVLGKPVHLQVGVKDKQARLADIVPAARVLSSRIVETTMKRLQDIGASVPCHKGCAACCTYYLVSISVPEVFRLVQETTMMPLERCGHIVDSCSKVAKRIRRYLEKHIALKKLTHTKTNSQALTLEIHGEELQKLPDWYIKQKLPCAFLRNRLCTIYEQRPVTCREHLVVGTVPCQLDKEDAERRMEAPTPPIRMVDALKLLASDLEGTNRESVPLPYAFDWYRANIQRSNRTWSALTIAERFIGIVRAMISESNRIRAERVKYESKQGTRS